MDGVPFIEHWKMARFRAGGRGGEQFNLGHVNFEGTGYKCGSWCIEVN